MPRARKRRTVRRHDVTEVRKALRTLQKFVAARAEDGRALRQVRKLLLEG